MDHQWPLPDELAKAREIIADGVVVKSNYTNSKGQPADRPGHIVSLTESYKLAAVLSEVHGVLERSVEKHAPMHSPHEGHSVIREEFEELWEHVRADTGRTPAARKEALQLAAMAVRYVVDLIDGDDR